MYFVCKYCREIFSDITLLKIHKSTVHTKNGSDKCREVVNLDHLSPPDVKTAIPQSNLNCSGGDSPGNPSWYQCDVCHIYLKRLTKFLIHLEGHTAQRRPGLFHMSDGVIMDISQLKTPQIFLPKISLTSCTETIQKFVKFVPAELSIKLLAITGKELESMKAEMTKRKLRPRSTLQKSWRVDDSDIEDEENDGDVSPTSGRRIRNGRIKFADKGWDPKRKNLDVVGTTQYVGKTYACQICSKPMPNLYRYKAHIAFHKRSEEMNKRKPFHCKICNVGFTRKENLVRHTFKHIDNNPFRCRICGRDTTSKDHLRRHLELHFDGSKVACEICGKEVVRLESLRRHMKTVHGTGAHFHANTKVNPQPSSSKTQLQRITIDTLPPVLLSPPRPTHDLIRVDASGKIKFEEDRKPISIPQKKAADLTEATSDSWRTAIITKMAELHPELGGLSRHTTGGTPGAFVCKYCSQASFSRSFALRFHVKTCHPQDFQRENEVKDVRMICGVCGFATTSAEEFSTHNKVSHSKLSRKPFHCTQCGTRFTHQVTLDRHVKSVHSLCDSPRHECPTCRKSYATELRLRKHQIRICNSTNKPEGVKFICSQCGKECKHRFALNLHLRLHSKERTLSVCKMCNETCATPNSLRRHIRLVHGNGIYRRNKGRERQIPLEPIPEDQLFLYFNSHEIFFCFYAI